MRLRHAVLKRSKEGVSSIVQSGMLAGKSPEEVEGFMLQSQLFFWNRCVTRLTSEEGTANSRAGSISWAWRCRKYWRAARPPSPRPFRMLLQA
jgi:hypothetical protein